MVDRLREVEICLGPRSLDLTSAEIEYREKHKKFPVIKRALPSGHQLVGDDILLKRVPNPPSELLDMKDMLGKELKISLQANVPILREYLK